MRDTRRPTDEPSQASEALADIALNSLGLILIVLLVYMVIFSQTTAARLKPPRTETVDGRADLAERQIRENHELRRTIKELQSRLQSQAQENDTSGLWRFQIHVTKLIDHHDRAEPADFTVDYFVWLQISDGSVRGSLFGVKEHGLRELGSSSHADISGVYRSQKMNIELAFTGAATGGSEILSVKKHGDQFVGELTSGKHRIGYKNYSGRATGSRLTASVFSR